MGAHRHRRRGGVLFVDYPVYLLVVFIALFLLTTAPKAARPTIDTLGAYAIVVTWPGTRDDDVDSYVQDPEGNIAFFLNTSAGLMHLEHDDLGLVGSGYGVGRDRRNGERVVLRGTVSGEYVVNVHMYRKGANPALTPVTVALYRLRGADAEIALQHLALGATGDEQTAFRFSLNAVGNVTGRNRLPKRLVRSVAPPPDAVAPPSVSPARGRDGL